MQKVAQNVTISLGYFIFSNNHNELPKVSQLAKIPNLVTLVMGRTVFGCIIEAIYSRCFCCLELPKNHFIFKISFFIFLSLS